MIWPKWPRQTQHNHLLNPNRNLLHSTWSRTDSHCAFEGAGKMHSALLSEQESYGWPSCNCHVIFLCVRIGCTKRFRQWCNCKTAAYIAYTAACKIQCHRVIPQYHYCTIMIEYQYSKSGWPVQIQSGSHHWWSMLSSVRCHESRWLWDMICNIMLQTWKSLLLPALSTCFSNKNGSPVAGVPWEWRLVMSNASQDLLLPPFQCFSKFQSIRYVDAARPGQLYNSWCFVGEDATATCRQVGWGGESLNPDESWCWNWSSLNTTRYVIWMTPEVHTWQASVSCERLVGGASCTSGSCWCGWLGWRLGPANHRVTQHVFFGRWNPEGIHRNPDGWVVSKIFWQNLLTSLNILNHFKIFV